MSLPFPIVADVDAMTITVGPKTYDRPYLRHMSERDRSIKEDICGYAPAADLKGVYQYFASKLGCKFNRRFQAANYWLWLGDRMSPRTANMLRHDGNNWHRYNERLVWRANRALPYVSEAEFDGLYNIIPAIVTFGMPPQQIRRLIGRGAWKRFANNSVSRNVQIMQAMQRVRGDDTLADAGMFTRLLEFPSGVLRAVQGATNDEVIAARIAPRKRPLDFVQTVHLVRDTKEMLGFAFNPAWGHARMVREHDDAVRNIMRKRFSDKRFADDWAFEKDGRTATLLTSQLDIATEGETQHHCVASYAKHAAQGKYAVLRIDGKDRATAGIRGDRIDQVYGACNSPVSDECMAFVYQAANAYAKSLRRAA